eukprot:gene24109-9684_t
MASFEVADKGIEITTALVSNVCARYPLLKTLNLSNNTITRIQNLEPLTSLTKLDLSLNRIHAMDSLNLEPLTKLTKLDLSLNRIHAMDGLVSLTNLRELWLQNNLISSVSSSCSQLTCLALLDLSHNQLHIGDWVHVLSAMPSLTHLSLAGNPICDTPGYPSFLLSALAQTSSRLPSTSAPPLQQQQQWQQQYPLHVMSESANIQHQPNPLALFQVNTTSPQLGERRQVQQPSHQGPEVQEAGLQDLHWHTDRAVNQLRVVLSPQSKQRQQEQHSLSQMSSHIQLQPGPLAPFQINTTSPLRHTALQQEFTELQLKYEGVRGELVEAKLDFTSAVPSSTSGKTPTTSAPTLSPAVAANAKATSGLPGATTPIHRPEDEAMAAQVKSLSHIVHIQQQELERLIGLKSNSVNDPTVTGELVRGWRDEVSRLLAIRSQESAAFDSDRKEWKQQVVSMQEEFKQVQVLMQILEQRCGEHRSEAEVATTRCSSLRAELQAERAQVVALEQRLVKQRVEGQAVEEQLQRFQVSFTAKLAALDAAGDKVEAYASRVHYARQRLEFAAMVQGQAGIVVPSSPSVPAASRPSPRELGHTDGTARGGALAIEVLRSEISRLTEDRDRLLTQLSRCSSSLSERVAAAVAVVKEEEVKTRQAEVDRLVAGKERKLKNETEQKKRELQHAYDQVRQSMEDGVDEMARKFVACFTELESKAGLALATLAVRVSDMQQQAVRLKSSTDHAKDEARRRSAQLLEVQSESASWQDQVADLEKAMGALKREMRQQREELEEKMGGCVGEERRKAIEAQREASKAAVMARQLERQLTRLEGKKHQEEANRQDTKPAEDTSSVLKHSPDRTEGGSETRRGVVSGMGLGAALVEGSGQTDGVTAQQIHYFIRQGEETDEEEGVTSHLSLGEGSRGRTRGGLAFSQSKQSIQGSSLSSRRQATGHASNRSPMHLGVHLSSSSESSSGHSGVDLEGCVEEITSRS